MWPMTKKKIIQWKQTQKRDDRIGNSYYEHVKWFPSKHEQKCSWVESLKGQPSISSRDENTIAGIKNLLEVFNSRSDTEENKINVLEYI